MARLKPLPRSERLIKYGGTQNRCNIKRRTNDEVKNVEVGLLDVDASIMYYFNNVIKPTVMEQGEEVKVPLMYANPERWATIRKTGFMRDSKRQLITPVIAFRRTSMAKRTELPVDKLDANEPKLHYTFEHILPFLRSILVVFLNSKNRFFYFQKSHLLFDQSV